MGKIRIATYQDIDNIKDILNKYLSYGLATVESVRALLDSGENKVYEEDNKIIGYINLHTLKKGDFIKEPKTAKIAYGEDKIITHIVVDKTKRNRGIGGKLLRGILEDITVCQNVYVIGWVKSSDNKWDAETICNKEGLRYIEYIDEYFNDGNKYPCEYCEDYCKCSAKIYKYKR